MERANPKECPFCGTDPETDENPVGRWPFISCESGNCGVRPWAEGETFDIALERWNERAR